MKDRLRGLPVIGPAIRMQERYVADAADALAAAIGLFGFLSLFPLIALLLAAVGFFLGDDPEIRDRAVELVTSSVPALSAVAGGDTDVATAIDGIADNSGTLLGVGSIGLLLTALRIASGCQQACHVVFRREPATGLMKRVQQLRGLVVVGVFALAGAAVSGTVGIDLAAPDGLVSAVTSLAGLALAYVLDVALFMLAYRLFTPGSGPSWRTLLPGSLLGAAGWVGLKVFGTAYVTRSVTNAQSTYGALASIIGLLLLLYLAGRLFLYGAELAAVLGGVGEEEPEEEPEELVSPRPVVDVAPPPADLVRLTGAAAVLAFLARAIDE